MRVICDTRERNNGHILSYFDKNGIDFEIKKLDVADYMIDNAPNLVIDRKQNLEELARNLCNKKDHSRFWKEVRRAREQKIKMIVLCEHSKFITCIEDVATWHSKFSPVPGRHLMDEIFRVHMAYGVEFLFCSKKDMPERILELLNYAKQ